MKICSAFVPASVLIVVHLAFAPTTIYGQSIDRQVISSSGENFQTTNGSLLFTIGELAVETYKVEGQYSQGFHQEWVVITSVDPTSAKSLCVKVYPNPTRGLLQIESASDLDVLIYDLSGKLKRTTTLPSGVGQIQMDDFPSGIYMLEVKDVTSKPEVFKILKLD